MSLYRGDICDGDILANLLAKLGGRNARQSQSKLANVIAAAVRDCGASKLARRID